HGTGHLAIFQIAARQWDVNQGAVGFAEQRRRSRVRIDRHYREHGEFGKQQDRIGEEKTTRLAGTQLEFEKILRWPQARQARSGIPRWRGIGLYGQRARLRHAGECTSLGVAESEGSNARRRLPLFTHVRHAGRYIDKRRREWPADGPSAILVVVEV